MYIRKDFREKIVSDAEKLTLLLIKLFLSSGSKILSKNIFLSRSATLQNTNFSTLSCTTYFFLTILLKCQIRLKYVYEIMHITP